MGVEGAQEQWNWSGGRRVRKRRKWRFGCEEKEEGTSKWEVGSGKGKGCGVGKCP